MSEESDDGPPCPSCGNSGPSRGTSFCVACGEPVNWTAAAALHRPSATPATGPVGDHGDDRVSVPDSVAEPETVATAVGRRPVTPESRARPNRERRGDPGDRYGRGDPDASDDPGDRHDGRDDDRDEYDDDRTTWSSRRSSDGPDGSSAPRTLLIVGAVVAALAVLAAAAFFVVPQLVGSSVLEPDLVTTTGTDPKHPVDSAFDTDADSWWGITDSGTAVDGQGSLTAVFDDPVDLSSVRVTPGCGPAAFYTENRPSTVEIDAVDSDGHLTKTTTQLADGGTQNVPASVEDAKKITLVVRDAHRSPGAQDVAISDVVFLSA